MVTTKIMQQIWTVIESTQVNTLLQVDDATLVQLLVQQLKANQVIDVQVDYSLNTYIKSKLSLIRDTAESRLSFSQGNH